MLISKSMQSIVLMLSHSISHYQSYWNIWKKFTKIRIWFESVVASTSLWSSSTSLSALSIQNSLEYSAFWTTTISLWWTTFRIKSTIVFRNALSVCLIKFSSLDKLKIFLQDVNNKQRVNYQLRDEQWTVKSIAASKKRFVSSSTSASVSTTSYVQLITFFILESEWSRMSIICFNCKVSNHLSKNCSQLKTSTSTSHAFISRLNEIIMSKEEKKLFTEKSKNETKN